MIRTHKHKLVNYHGHEGGELFDMEKDPHEFENLWDDPAHVDVRFELMKKNFDESNPGEIEDFIRSVEEGSRGPNWPGRDLQEIISWISGKLPNN